MPDPAHRCPGCAAPNNCAIAADQPAAGCWCMATGGAPLPLPLGDASCYCANCLTRLRQGEARR